MIVSKRFVKNTHWCFIEFRFSRPPPPNPSQKGSVAGTPTTSDSFWFYFVVFVTNAYKLVCACNRATPIVPLLFILNTFFFFAKAPIGFVHVFQLWAFPEPWTLLFSFVIGPHFDTYSNGTYPRRRPSPSFKLFSGRFTPLKSAKLLSYHKKYRGTFAPNK